MTTITSIHDLTTELENQLKKLTLLQDEIGYSDDIKREKTTSFLNSVSQFVQSQVNIVVQEKENITSQAEMAHKSILAYKKLMGEFASNKAVLDPNKTLQTNLNELIQEKAQVKEVCSILP